MGDFLASIFKGTRLGLEEKHIRIDYDCEEEFTVIRNRSPTDKFLHSTNLIKFKILLPYAGTHLSFLVVIRVSRRFNAPRFYFPDVFSPELISLLDWHPRNACAFISILKEIRDHYGQHYVDELKQFPSIYEEYLHFEAEEPDDIEVMIHPNKNVTFIIRLNLDISHVHDLKTDDIMLLEAFFRNGDTSDVRLTVSICDSLHNFLSLLDFSFPVTKISQSILYSKQLIEQKFNAEIIKHFPKSSEKVINVKRKTEETNGKLPVPCSSVVRPLAVPWYISNFLTMVTNGICLGLENANIDIREKCSINPCKDMRKKSMKYRPFVNGDLVSFTMVLPYATTWLQFKINLSKSKPCSLPTFRFYKHLFSVSPDSMDSLCNWDPKNPNCILNVVHEIRGKYKERFVNLLRKYPALKQEYNRFAGEGLSDDIEIFIQRNNDVIFLIRLRFGISQAVEHESSDRILLKFVFKEGNLDDFNIKVLSNGIWENILELIKLHLPDQRAIQSIRRYKFCVEQKLNEDILKLMPNSKPNMMDSYNITSEEGKICFHGVKSEHFLNPLPPYVSDFLEAVSSGICLGVENVNIHIKGETSSTHYTKSPGTKKSKLYESSNIVRYTVLLPYAETELEISFDVELLNANTPPNFIFDVHSFNPSPESLASLRNWNSQDSKSLLNVMKEIREHYKEYNICKLQQFPLVYKEYQHFIAAEMTKSVEVLVTGKGNVIFLICLCLDISHIPHLKDSRLLLHILFGKGNVLYMRMRIISDDSFDAVLKLINFTVPEQLRTMQSSVERPNFQSIITYKSLIEQEFNHEILKIYPKLKK